MRIRSAAPLILASTLFYLQPAYAETDSELLNLDLETLMTIKVGPSADASAKGLSEAFAGGQIAKGGRIGILTTQELSDTPFSYTNYTQEFIQNHQAESVGDVLQYDPSVRVARGFGNFQQVYKVRGLPIFSDDMTYNGLYGILPRQYLAAEAIERVEVLRGSNSFLNGAAPGVSGSLGGAIDVIPKRAPKENLTQFTFGAQSADQHYAAADIARRSSDGSLGIRFNGVDSGGNTPVDDESRNLDLAVLGADYRSATLRLSADLGYQNHRMNANQPSITIAENVAIPDAPSADDNLAQPWTFANEMDVFATLRAEYDFNQTVTGWAAVGAREGSEESRLGAFQTVINNAGDFSTSRFDVIHKDAITTGELGLRSEFESEGIQHHLTIAVNSYQNRSRNAYMIYGSFDSNLYNPINVVMPTNALFGGGALGHPLVTNITKTSSTALADEMTLLDQRLWITLGVRDQRIQENNYNYDSGVESSRYDEHKLTPMAAAVYKITPKYSLYANYIEGLLKGDIAPESSGSGLVTNAGQALKPYQTQQFEAGLKYEADNLGAILSLFEIRKPVAGYTSTNSYALTHDQTHRGMEISVYGLATPNLKILGGASLLNTNVQGKDALGAPNLQANLDLEWAPLNLPNINLISHLMYTSSQYANATNTQEAPAWTRLDLGVRYNCQAFTDHTLTLRATLENITNTEYWASVGGFPGASYLTLGSPRTLLVSASLNY